MNAPENISPEQLHIKALSDASADRADACIARANGCTNPALTRRYSEVREHHITIPARIAARAARVITPSLPYLPHAENRDTIGK